MNDLENLDSPRTPAGDGVEARQKARVGEAHGDAAEGEAAAAPGRDAGGTSVAHRGAADPVKVLMRRHRKLCERAVDPLEIAAGLEAHGVTDRTAARFRHRDVFSLAEEMYARVPRDGDPARRPTPTTGTRPRADWIVRTLLPGTLCAATLAGLHLTHGRARLVLAAVGTLAVALALRAALSRGPLGTNRARPGPHPAPGARTWTCWLVAYAVLGDGLLQAAASGGPDGLPAGAADSSWPLTIAPLLALTLACAPAAWSAHLFAARARHKLTASRGLEEFAASVRPLLLGTFTLFLAALTGLLALSAATVDDPAAPSQTLTLGALLFLARLLTIHGFTHAPAVLLTAAATAEATALATLFAGRLPHCDFLAAPAQALLDTWGPGSIPTLACGAAAAALLLHAFRRLTRASAHGRTDGPW
ncbi:hypothetical protein [Streptomyces sp. HC307]|uniref:hypothetical protein n=1 Tax=Streptomyces flavusporus TaxID=3385496 RepID=UPI003917547A